MATKILITADDYGMSEPVNQAIEECLVAGAMQATCVMTNMPSYRASEQLRETFPNASIGLHWTLTQGKPVLPVASVSSLVNADGQFFQFSEFRRRWMAGSINRAEVVAELRAQDQRFRELAGLPDFWNTHQNVHLTPGLFEISVSLGLHLGIALMRCHRRATVWEAGSVADYNLRHPAYWVKGQVITAWSRWAERRGAIMPNALLDTPGFVGGKADVEQIVSKLLYDNEHSQNIVELAIHPSTKVQPELFGAITDARVREYKVFSDPSLKNRLAANGADLVSFQELVRHSPLPSGNAI